MKFAHSNLAAYEVIKEAVVRGESVAKALPRAHAKLADQLRRALQGAFLQFVEGVARDGDDRRSRLRTARAEAGEAAAALDLVQALNLVRIDSIPTTIAMLSRFSAMTTGLGKFKLGAVPEGASPSPPTSTQPPTLSPTPGSGPRPAPDPRPDRARAHSSAASSIDDASCDELSTADSPDADVDDPRH